MTVKVSYPAGFVDTGYSKILIPIVNHVSREWYARHTRSVPWPGYNTAMMEILGYVFDESSHTFTFENEAEYTLFLLRWS